MSAGTLTDTERALLNYALDVSPTFGRFALTAPHGEHHRHEAACWELCRRSPKLLSIRYAMTGAPLPSGERVDVLAFQITEAGRAAIGRPVVYFERHKP